MSRRRTEPDATEIRRSLEERRRRRAHVEFAGPAALSRYDLEIAYQLSTPEEAVAHTLRLLDNQIRYLEQQLAAATPAQAALEGLDGLQTH